MESNLALNDLIAKLESIFNDLEYLIECCNEAVKSIREAIDETVKEESYLAWRKFREEYDDKIKKLSSLDLKKQREELRSSIEGEIAKLKLEMKAKRGMLRIERKLSKRRERIEKLESDIKEIEDKLKEVEKKSELLASMEEKIKFFEESPPLLPPDICEQYDGHLEVRDRVEDMGHGKNKIYYRCKLCGKALRSEIVE